MPDPDYGRDPSSGELADVARSGAREWERDMAAWEADAEQLRLRQRTIGRALWEAMQRGDHVSITLGEHEFAGSITAARGDLVMLRTRSLELALNVAAIDLVHLQPGRDGTTGDRTFGSLRAFAGMLEVEGTPTRILGEGVDVRGRLRVVADDHVMVEGSAGQWIVAWAAIAAIVPQ